MTKAFGFIERSADSPESSVRTRGRTVRHEPHRVLMDCPSSDSRTMTVRPYSRAPDDSFLGQAREWNTCVAGVIQPT